MKPRTLGTYEPGSPDWHAARRWRIGGSEIAQVMGWSRFGTRDDLLAAKLNPVDKPPSRAMLRGTLLEPSVLSWGAARHGYQYADGSNGTYLHGVYDWAVFNPDALIVDGPLVEVKTTADRSMEMGWGRAGTDQIPLYYRAQVAHGMAVMDLPEAHVLVLAGAHSGRPDLHFSRYVVKRDRAFENRLLAAGLAFIRELNQLRNERGRND